MGRAKLAANATGKVSIVPMYVDPQTGREQRVPREARSTWPAAAVSRWAVSGLTRVQDRSVRDPETGAFTVGRRVQIRFSSTTGDRARCEQEFARLARKAQTEAAWASAGAAQPGHPIGPIVEQLLAQREVSGEYSAGTMTAYRNAERRLRETGILKEDIASVTSTRVGEVLRLIATKASVGRQSSQGGTAVAKTSRSVLSLAFKHGISQGWIGVNPVRDAGEIRRPKRRTTERREGIDHERALTKEEKVRLAWSVARSERAVRLDVRDLILAGLAIGGRIGEVCAIRWCDVSFFQRSTGAGTVGMASVTISGTIVRRPGVGLARETTKTASSVRTLPLPPRIAALLRRRARAAGVQLDKMRLDHRPVFPAPGRWELPEERYQLRDSSNTASALRVEFDRAGLDWITFHGLRRSALTALADVLPIRQVADFAGHSSIKTTIDSYLARGRVSEQVADLL
ncbi:tyrosine-type recombinase/integrase [Nakamurella sp. YIM 132087]|uniref:Tyrosine-type recombinase/integrase n=1 Tax=Nakamurella alba TaxID=2665158 RepID=A0A7K1FWK7_9ACTN|nr:tyrosine-type recombinase/integrase [Nakamurella alba]MTD17204.1 tyrosine-type recombinase/integrase [Nakamurella alba]